MLDTKELIQIYNSHHLDQYKLDRSILIIDMKSFYASVECAMRGLDIFTTPLVVADASRGGGSVVMSVTPFLKKRGVHNICRIYELPKNLNIIYATPRMSLYLQFAKRIISIFLRYVSYEDLHVYSVDESFLDVTNYLSTYNCTPLELAKRIMKDIKDELGLFSACGIGKNMLLAKLALDIESKSNPDFIAIWDYSSIPVKLWPITSLTDMWSIGIHIEARLHKMGIYSLGDIATKFTSKDLAKEFGILGSELWHHVHGCDMSIISTKLTNAKPKEHSISNTQVLFRDYFHPEIQTLILEMCDVVAKRLRDAKVVTKLVHLYIGYSKDIEGGFSHQLALSSPTNEVDIIYEACKAIFLKYYVNLPIRRVGVGCGKLIDRSAPYQGSLFHPYEEVEKKANLNLAIDEIKNKYGDAMLIKGASLLTHSTYVARSKMIGGHNAGDSEE